MANATKYVDNVLGHDANSGNAPGSGSAYATHAYALSQITGGGNTIYTRNTGVDYLLTAPVVIALSGDATNGRNRIEGYTTTPGARDGRPTITCATNGVNLFELNNGSAGWDFVHLQGAHTAGTRGSFLAGTGTGGQASCSIEDCLVDGCAYLVNGSARQIIGLTVAATTARNGTVGVIINGSTADVIDGCLFYANAGTGYSANNTNTVLTVIGTVWSGGTKAISDGSAGSARSFVLALVGCSFRGQSGSAIVQENVSSIWTVSANRNNVFWAIGGYGWALLDPAADVLFRSGASGAGRNNFAGALSSAYQNNFANGVGLVTLSADPFVNAGSGNFGLNAISGGGALVRAAGYPGTYPGGTTTGYADGGAVQHQDSGGGSTGGPPRVLTPNTWSLVG